MNKDFGFEMNRPFYIRSRMPMGRVIEWAGSGHIHIRSYRAGQKSQQFYFDGITKTVKSNNWKSHSINIVSDGKSNHVTMSGTNSRWF
jgi:hypothetical protein